MIRRRQGNDILLIRQTDHASISGALAKHLGNAMFTPPSPFSSVVEAISAHDAGWPLHDDRPTLNDQGLPRHVFEMPLSTALEIWTESSRRVAAADPYVGLLVSLHQLGLSSNAEPKPSAEPSRHTPRELFDLNRFQHGQVELQEQLRRQLGMRTDLPLDHGLAPVGRSPEEDLLRCNHQLLQLFDRISLNLCFNEVRIAQVDHVCPRPGRGGICVHVHKNADDSFRLDPWPFDRDEIALAVPAKRLCGSAFASEDEFRKAYDEAPESRLALRAQRT